MTHPRIANLLRRLANRLDPPRPAPAESLDFITSSELVDELTRRSDETLIIYGRRTVGAAVDFKWSLSVSGGGSEQLAYAIWDIECETGVDLVGWEDEDEGW